MELQIDDDTSATKFDRRRRWRLPDQMNAELTRQPRRIFHPLVRLDDEFAFAVIPFEMNPDSFFIRAIEIAEAFAIVIVKSELAVRAGKIFSSVGSLTGCEMYWRTGSSGMIEPART